MSSHSIVNNYNDDTTTTSNKKKNYESNNNIGVNKPPNIIIRDTAPPVVHRYVPADFDFGFSLLPSSIDYDGIPLRLCLIRSSRSNWTTTTVSMDHSDIILKNGEMFLLLCDYFSLYFQDSFYGHPGVAAYDQMSTEMKPSGGVDTRLFFSRPHVSISEGTYDVRYIV